MSEITLNDIDVVKIVQSKFDYEVVYLDPYPIMACIGSDVFAEKNIYNFFEKHYNNIAFSKSHSSKLVFVFDEVMDVSVIIGLHQWLYRKPCNLNNVILIVTMNFGVADWYKNYLNTTSTYGFKVVEVPTMSKLFLPHYAAIPKLTTSSIQKHLKYYFSFYGGTAFSGEKLFLTTLFNSLNIGFIDLFYDPKTLTPEMLAIYEGNLEQFTNFSDRQFVDTYLTEFTKLKISSDTKQFFKAFNEDSFQQKVDGCSAFRILRETQHTLAYSSMTEKTLSGFVNFQIPVPLSGINAVDNLKKLGFIFDDTIINYDYQAEPLFFNRAMKAADLMKTISNTYTLGDLEDYILEKSDILCYNYNYLQSGQYLKNLKNMLFQLLQS